MHANSYTFGLFRLRAIFALGVVLLLALTMAAEAQNRPDRLSVRVSHEEGYGRIVLDFVGRLDLPEYEVKVESNVLVVGFSSSISTNLPEVTEHIGDFVAVARLDPDQKGLRFGLKGEFRISQHEAGERLFIDLLPEGWVGLPPPLPDDVIAELSRRAQDAARVAEAKRKAELARENPPDVTVKVGRNPTFTRLRFTWQIDTDARFEIIDNGEDGTTARIRFGWPVDVDMSGVLSDQPPEIVDFKAFKSGIDTVLAFTLAQGTEPRFYEETVRREFVLDLDFSGDDTRVRGLARPLDRLDLEELAEVAEAAEAAEEAGKEPQAEDPLEDDRSPIPSSQGAITPFVNTIGETVRLIFPFEQDTPAAVFRRADTLWLIFDTHVTINAPSGPTDLDPIANAFEASSANELQVVRMAMNNNGLATLGSEGRAWVLSVGEILFAPTEPVDLQRRRNEDGTLFLAADLGRPARVHELRDPDVGDMLKVATAYAPARAVVRRLDHVDFTALPALHGLVVRPNRSDVELKVNGSLATIGAKAGLFLSNPSENRTSGTLEEAIQRASFIDMQAYRRERPDELVAESDKLMTIAAESEGTFLDSARLELARFYLSNELPHEAIGVAQVLRREAAGTALADRSAITLAAANVAANRPSEALSILLQDKYLDAPDAVMWRTIARNDTGDWEKAREDALVAEPVIEHYPVWVQHKFLFAAIRAAIETGDSALAFRLLPRITTRSLSPQDTAIYNLLLGRLDEMEGRQQEALDTYATVIAADFRPVKAAAVLRTLHVLDDMGRLDIKRAAETLAVEQLVWRGDVLEARMMKLLGELYFRNGAYRLGFETMRQASKVHDGIAETRELYATGQRVFADLYLNGVADTLEPVEAMGIFYDFRQLTPSGARGDEMIRNLARRLIKVDLLDQAAGLLEYQVDNRLEGAGRASIAADLAVIHLANRRPDLALKALYRTAIANLNPALERQRRLLEAKSLIDAGRDELALELVSKLAGPDIDLLRIDAHWRGKRYREAGELIEGMVGALATSTEFPAKDRKALVRAAVAYALADDEIGLSRLRAKFADRLAAEPEWPIFQFVTSKSAPTSYEFRAIAREIAGTDALNAFLDAYRANYAGQGALMPDQAAKPVQDV